MRLIIYSETTAASIRENMGRAEYSYYFILEKYLPLLSRIGDIRYVRDPAAEVDALYDEALAAGEEAVFLSFTPPHRTAKNLRCPVICVLAWEYDSIPDESWDPAEPWHNWVKAIQAIGNVITISDHATRVIRRQVGPGPRVVTIPAPVVPLLSLRGRVRNLFSTASRKQCSAGSAKTPMHLSADIIDTHAMIIDAQRAVVGDAESGQINRHLPRWEGGRVAWEFTSSAEEGQQQLVGFYDQEHWGVWSRTATPMLLLPWALWGDVELGLELLPYAENEGQTLEVRVGDAVERVELRGGLHEYRFSFTALEGAATIGFAGFAAIAVPGARDHRTLGIGLRSLHLSGRPSGTREASAPAPMERAEKASSELALSGTVYSTLLNPADGRKNWEDIVTAFCWTFRDEPDKTLLLKMAHRSRTVFLARLLLLFSRLSPFKCRVVAIHGYLPSEQFDALIANTDYFVNASTAEGQCLPLLEFMARGVPAIAPDHTAMETYINSANAFVIRTSEQPSMWPQDPRRASRTLCYRTDWESLARAYRDSDLMLREDRAGYQAMGRAAKRTVKKYYDAKKIARQLRKFLREVAAGE